MLISSPVTVSKRVYGVVAVAGLASLFGIVGLGLWWLTPFPQGARLMRVTFFSFSRLPCSSTLVVSGPALSFRAEWRIEAAVVQVLHDFRQQGWSLITHGAENIELLPLKPTTIGLGLWEMRVFQEALLSNTSERTTRLRATTAILICPN